MDSFQAQKLTSGTLGRSFCRGADADFQPLPGQPDLCELADGGPVTMEKDAVKTASAGVENCRQPFHGAAAEPATYSKLQIVVDGGAAGRDTP